MLGVRVLFLVDLRAPLLIDVLLARGDLVHRDRVPRLLSG